MPNAPKVTEVGTVDKLTESSTPTQKLTEGADAFQVRSASGPRFVALSPRAFIFPPV